jgi:hypothetical protein
MIVVNDIAGHSLCGTPSHGADGFQRHCYDLTETSPARRFGKKVIPA